MKIYPNSVLDDFPCTTESYSFGQEMLWLHRPRGVIVVIVRATYRILFWGSWFQFICVSSKSVVVLF
jgi:hypothetical protein